MSIISNFPAKVGIELPALSVPASAENIQSGLQAIDANGELIVGTGHIAGINTILFIPQGYTLSYDEVIDTITETIYGGDSVAIADRGISSTCGYYIFSLYAAVKCQGTFSIVMQAADGTTGSVSISLEAVSGRRVALKMKSADGVTPVGKYVKRLIFGLIDTQSII